MRKKAACFDKNILNIFATAVATGYNVTMENVRIYFCTKVRFTGFKTERCGSGHGAENFRRNRI